MNALATTVTAWVWRHRLACVLSCCAITALAALPANRIGVDNSLEIWFVEDDPRLSAYREHQSVFGNDEVIVIALHDPRGLSADALERIEDVRARLERIDGIAYVTNNPATQGRIVSEDGTTASLLARLIAASDIDARRDGILAEVDSVLSTLDTPYYTAGIGLLYSALNKLSTSGSAVLLIAADVVMFLLLWCLFGRVLPALVVLAVVSTATIWLMGLYAAMGRDLNMVTMILPTLMLVIGTADCVHIFRSVASVPHDMPRAERVIEGVSRMFWPCLLTTLTAAAGFAALMTSSLQVVRDLGAFAALGLVGAFGAALVGCTWALQWEAVEPKITERDRLTLWALRLARLGTEFPRSTLAGAAVLVILAAVGVSRIVVDTYTIDFLFSDHPVRVQSDFIESHLGPYAPVEFVIASSNGVAREDVLQATQDWQRAAEQSGRVGWSSSLADLITLVPGGSSQRYTELQLSAYRDYNPTMLKSRFDGSNRMKIVFGVPMQSAGELKRSVQALRALAEMPDDVTVEASGYAVLYMSMVDYVLRSQLSSFALAFVTIFGAIALLFRSWRSVAIAVPANVLPVLATLGAMGWLGIRLDIATVTIATVVLGLVVDDTVHLLFRLQHESIREERIRRILHATVRTTGAAILMTTLVLVLGFSVLGLAQIKSVIWFGLLTGLALTTALLADLILIPALLTLSSRRTRTLRLRLAIHR